MRLSRGAGVAIVAVIAVAVAISIVVYRAIWDAQLAEVKYTFRSLLAGKLDLFTNFIGDRRNALFGCADAMSGTSADLPSAPSFARVRLLPSYVGMMLIACRVLASVPARR